MSEYLNIFLIFLLLVELPLLFCIPPLTSKADKIQQNSLDFPNTTEYPDYGAYKDYGDTNYEDFVMLMSGGYRPTRDKYSKFIVSIRTAKPTAYFGDNHFCSGTIISARLIVTAAHCIKDSNRIVTRPRRLVVVAGAPHRLKKSISSVELEVEQVLPHEQYIRKKSNDIALLRLKVAIPDVDRVISIMPLSKKVTHVGETCVAVGWGQLYYRGPFSAEPVYIDLEIIQDTECVHFYPSNFFQEGQICARSTEEDAQPCGGDSGGPLICNHKLAGIIAWGSRCDKEGHPVVFTDVFYHLAWIEANHGYQLSPFRLWYLVLVIIWLSGHFMQMAFIDCTQ